MAGKLFGAWPTVGSENTAASDTAKVNTTVIPKAKPGAIYPDKDGGLWSYVVSTAAVVEGDWVSLKLQTGAAIKAVTGNTTDGRNLLGIIGGTIAADDYGWAQVFGHNTHAGIVGDTETTAAETGSVLFVSATAGRATSDTAVPDLIYGAFTFGSTGANTADTAMGTGKFIDVNLAFPYSIGGATTVE